MLGSSIPFNEKFLSLGEAWEATARKGRGKEKVGRRLQLLSSFLLQQRFPLGSPAWSLGWPRMDSGWNPMLSPPQTPSGTLWRPAS